MKNTASVWPKYLFWIFIALAFVQIAILCTSPVKDGDLWWQMSYGKYALNNQTLIADHTAFTWTPTDGSMIYCCWLPQITFSILFSLGGLPLLFAFKYAVCILFLGLFLHAARLTGNLRNPIAWLIWIIAMAMANHSGAALKPEIFSFIGIMVTAYLWVRLRVSQSNSSKIPYFFPVVTLIWVNSHGGMIFGYTFIFLMWLGEEMNALFSRKERLPIGTRRHLFIAVVFCALTILVNPYGPNYPLDVAREIISSSIGELKTISDYQPAFSAQGKLLHLPEFLIGGMLVFLALLFASIRNRRVNWVIVLTISLFAFLYSFLLRTTFFLGATFAFSSLYLLKDNLSEGFKSPSNPAVKWVMFFAPAAVAVLISSTILYEKVSHPVLNRWFGYGMSMTNPVEEADYIKEHLSTLKLGNDYDSGAYLLWTLYPDQKHMIDPRYFPFRKWYAEYYNAFKSHNTQQFVDKMNCDIWCVGFLHREAVDWFQKSPDWKPLFYGARAVVFGRRDLYFEDTGSLGGEELDDIRILGRALHVLTFAININDWESATRIYHGAKKNFPDATAVDDARRVLEGIYSYNSRNYGDAASLLNAPKGEAVFRSDGVLLNSYLHLTVQNWNAKKDTEAFTYAQAALLTANNDLIAHYNYGVLGGYLASSGNTLQVAEGLPNWRNSLEFFLNNYQKVDSVPGQTAEVARAMLNNPINGRPPLMEPGKPAEEAIEQYQSLLKTLREESD